LILTNTGWARIAPSVAGPFEHEDEDEHEDEALLRTPSLFDEILV